MGTHPRLRAFWLVVVLTTPACSAGDTTPAPVATAPVAPTVLSSAAPTPVSAGAALPRPRGGGPAGGTVANRYCPWPGEGLLQIALDAGVELTTLRMANPMLVAGSVVHLPAGAVPPEQWTRPLPQVSGPADLPFGTSGIYLGRDNRRRRVSLTFDIGYVPENRFLMELLAERGVHATFFVVGETMSRYPQVITDALRYGHELANHSWTHDDMQYMTAAAVQAELGRTEQAVRAAAPSATTKPYFRAPFGSLSDTVIDVATREGYAIAGWTIDSGDWLPAATSVQVYNRVTQQICPGAIVVMHDINQANYPALLGILDFLADNDYTIEPLSALLAP